MHLPHFGQDLDVNKMMAGISVGENGVDWPVWLLGQTHILIPGSPEKILITMAASTVMSTYWRKNTDILCYLVFLRAEREARSEVLS